MTLPDLTELFFVHVGTVAEERYELTTLGVEISWIVLAAGVRDKGYMDSAAILHAEESEQLEILID
jgi:hypothetical protein